MDGTESQSPVQKITDAMKYIFEPPDSNNFAYVVSPVWSSFNFFQFVLLMFILMFLSVRILMTYYDGDFNIFNIYSSFMTNSNINTKFERYIHNVVDRELKKQQEGFSSGESMAVSSSPSEVPLKESFTTDTMLETTDRFRKAVRSMFGGFSNRQSKVGGGISTTQSATPFIASFTAMIQRFINYLIVRFIYTKKNRFVA